MAAYVQDVFMLFGDSITQGAWEPNRNGFGQRLSHVYARKLDVLNRGFGGYNTDWAIPVFEQCIAKSSDTHAPKLRVLAIWFGANDACVAPSPQHVPLTKYIANLKYMVSLIRSPSSQYYSPTTRIILISPPPINTLTWGAYLAALDPPLKLDREFEVTRAYAEAVVNVAKEEGVGYVNVWTPLWEAAGKEEKKLEKFLSDGLHLTGEGYKVVYDELMTTIAKQYPEVHYDNLRLVFPPWDEIDWKHPENLSQFAKKEA